MSHQPPRLRSDSTKTPISQKPSIQGSMVGNEGLDVVVVMADAACAKGYATVCWNRDGVPPGIAAETDSFSKAPFAWSCQPNVTVAEASMSRRATRAAVERVRLEPR